MGIWAGLEQPRWWGEQKGPASVCERSFGMNGDQACIEGQSIDVVHSDASPTFLNNQQDRVAVLGNIGGAESTEVEGECGQTERPLSERTKEGEGFLGEREGFQ